VIPFDDLDAAQFSVTGHAGSPVRLLVTATQPEGEGTGLSLRLDNDQCRYSIDGGSTWTPFSSGELYHDTRLPATTSPGGLSTIYVRIGGITSIAGGAAGARGRFLGSLRLTATYLAD
jgi:hypothetical protein